MADRTCPRCGAAFTLPSRLGRHLARKTPCDPILEAADQRTAYGAGVLDDPGRRQRTCNFCGRVFTTYTSMRRHVRGACKIAPNAKNGDAGMEVLYEHTLRRQAADIDALKAQNREILGLVRRLAAAPGGAIRQAGGGDQDNIAVQGEGNRVDSRKTIINSYSVTVLNAFGRERTGHLCAENIRTVLREATRAADPPTAAILQTAMLVYSDPDHPENLTCYLPNKKKDEALVRTSRPDGTTGWEVRPTSLVLPPMARRSVDTLFDNQPYEHADECGPLLKELADNEHRYASGAGLRPILVRNRELLARVLATLPVAGGEPPALPAAAEAVAGGAPAGGGAEN